VDNFLPVVIVYL